MEGYGIHLSLGEKCWLNPDTTTGEMSGFETAEPPHPMSGLDQFCFKAEVPYVLRS